MSWGYKIFFVIVVFVSGILFMVYKSTTTGSELVTTDYYDKELVYQKTIDARSNLQNLSDTISYSIVNEELVISFPRDFAGKVLEGEVTLYFPSDKSKDMVRSFSMQDSRLILPVKAGDKKEFTLQLNWQSGGIPYYFEKKILIK
ncbi:MAG: FixH family protein [Ginsengibacter sp.]